MTATRQQRAPPAQLAPGDRIDTPAPPVKLSFFLIRHDHRPRIAWSDLSVASSIRRQAVRDRRGMSRSGGRLIRVRHDLVLSSEFSQDGLRAPCRGRLGAQDHHVGFHVAAVIQRHHRCLPDFAALAGVTPVRTVTPCAVSAWAASSPTRGSSRSTSRPARWQRRG